MANFKKALIVGASSGIGEALALRFVRGGYRVALVARREDVLRKIADSINSKGAGRALVYPCDVTDYEKAPTLFQEIVHGLGGLDVTVYCAGVMPPVAVDEYEFSKDRQVFEVNVLGAIAWLNQAAIRAEASESGTIVGISSVAGDRGRKPQPVYCASKAALNTYLEGLRNRLGHRGVRVITIKPGPTKTPMTEGLKMPFMITAEDSAEKIFRAVQSRKQVAYVPGIWLPIMTAIRCVPSFLFRGKDI